jgi:hypothetical protein
MYVCSSSLEDLTKARVDVERKVPGSKTGRIPPGVWKMLRTPANAHHRCAAHRKTSRINPQTYALTQVTVSNPWKVFLRPTESISGQSNIVGGPSVLIIPQVHEFLTQIDKSLQIQRRTKSLWKCAGLPKLERAKRAPMPSPRLGATHSNHSNPLQSCQHPGIQIRSILPGTLSGKSAYYFGNLK